MEQRLQAPLVQAPPCYCYRFLVLCTDVTLTEQGLHGVVKWIDSREIITRTITRRNGFDNKEVISGPTDPLAWLCTHTVTQ